MRTRADREKYQMALHSITPGDGIAWHCWMHAGNVYSPRSRLTQMWTSSCYKQNRDSSENTTLDIRASRFVVEQAVKGVLVCDVALSLGKAMIAVLLHDSPGCCKHCWIIRAETCFLVNNPISWHRICSLVVWSIKAMRVIQGGRNWNTPTLSSIIYWTTERKRSKILEQKN